MRRVLICLLLAVTALLALTWLPAAAPARGDGDAPRAVPALGAGSG